MNKMIVIDKKRKALAKLPDSFGFAFEGLKFAFQTQLNFRIELIAGSCTVVAAALFHISIIKWLLVLICIALVLFAELVNTAIEKLSDLVDENFHPGIKIVKDVAAGAVLVLAVTSFIVGIIIFLPPIVHLLS